MPFLGFLIIFLFGSMVNLSAHDYRTNDTEKLYIHPEQIRLTVNGIYLNTGNFEWTKIQNLQSDNSGVFTIVEKEETLKYTSYTCPGCGKIYYWWENCSTPGCPRR